jgi:hypothetical protein
MEMVQQATPHKAVQVGFLVVEAVRHGTMPRVFQQLVELAQSVLFGEQAVHSHQQIQQMYNIDEPIASSINFT